MINLKIANPQILQNAAKLCLKTVPKVVILDYVQIEIRALHLHVYAILVRRNTVHVRVCTVFVDLRKFKSTNHRKTGPLIANPQSDTFAEGPQIANLTNYLSPQICGFAIC